MYLIESGGDREKSLYTLLESAMDFVLEDDCYIYEHPAIFRLNGHIFEPFMRFQYRGIESMSHTEGKPPHCDDWDFSFWDRQEENWPWKHAGWVDAEQNGKEMREIVQRHVTEIEAKIVGETQTNGQ